MKIEIYDTTLRDGAQGAGVDFTDDNRISIIHALDELGVTYIEAGNIASKADAEFFAHCDEIKLKNSKLVAFCSTRHAGRRTEDDAGLAALAASPVEYVAIFGKCWEYQVTTVLGTSAEENYAMISESIKYLKAAGKTVLFDAEHFFDGFSDNPDFAISVLETAYEAGADYLVLCDTNGGMMPHSVGVATSTVKKRLPSAKLSIHCHNDLEMAAACSAEAVMSGAIQVQCTVCGLGERCGNCNLNTILPLLQLKLGYQCVSPEQLTMLTSTARSVMESANISFDEHKPFVGGYAFTHKAGMHIDGVRKMPRTFEHIRPELVGNSHNLLISSMAGKSAYRAVIEKIAPELHVADDPEKLSAVISKIKEYEAKGFQFESAEASVYLIMLEALGMKRHSFDLLTFRVMISEPMSIFPDSKTSALIKVSIPKADGTTAEEITAGEGDGPVNALDVALRRALSGFYPKLSSMRLSDYKVRVLDSSNTTASSVRVYIESTDGETLR